MAMESIDGRSPPDRSWVLDERLVDSVIDDLAGDFGDSIAFVIEISDETVIPHLFHGDAIPGADEIDSPDHVTLMELCRRMERYFSRRKSMWRLLDKSGANAEYMSTWCQGIKIVRLAFPEAEFFVGLTPDCPVVPIINAIYEECGGNLSSNTGGDTSRPGPHPMTIDRKD